MTRTVFARMIPAAAIATVALTWSGFAQEPGVGKKAGEKFDAAVQDIKGGLSKAGEAVKDRYSRAKTSAGNLGVEARIYSRLRWDKALADSSVELTGEESGVFTLTGQVTDAAAKQRAVNLAETTVGVTRVIDQLSIRPAGEATTTTTTTTTTTKSKTAKPARP